MNKKKHANSKEGTPGSAAVQTRGPSCYEVTLLPPDSPCRRFKDLYIEQ